MRFYPDRPDIVTKIRWYFVPEDAPKLPYENVFTSRIWYDGNGMQWPTLGEVNGAPREWTRGDPPVGLKPDSCQTNPHVWTQGVPYDLHNTAPYDASGVLLCCLELTPVAVIDVFSPDNSIFVSPHDGHVLEIINTGHTNNWLIVQTFKPAAVSQAALIVEELAGQTAEAFQVQTVGGTPVIAADPNITLVLQGRASGFEVLHIKDQGGSSVFEVNQDGTIGTSAVQAAAILGAVTGSYPIKDMGGTLLGNLPLYDMLPAATILVEDNFTGANGDPLVARIPDTTNYPGGRWSAETGGWQILSNQLNLLATTFNWDFPLIECGHADGTIEVDVPNDSTGWLFIIARANNDRTCVVAGIRAANSIGIYTFVNNQFRLLNSAAYARTGSAATMTLKMVGPELRLDVGTSNVSATSAMGLQVSTHGLGGNDNGSNYSKFKFTT